MEKQKQEKWLTALQFAELAGHPGDPNFIKNKVCNGRIIKSPRQIRRGGKPTGLWPESYVTRWIADMHIKTPRLTEQQAIKNRELDNNLALAFITGRYFPKYKQKSQFFKRMHARIAQPKTVSIHIKEQA